MNIRSMERAENRAALICIVVEIGLRACPCSPSSFTKAKERAEYEKGKALALIIADSLAIGSPLAGIQGKGAKNGFQP